MRSARRPAAPTASWPAFAAINVGSLDQTLASGFVTAGAGSTTGGLVASNTFNYVLPASVAPFIDPPGTATNSYWDTQSTGQSQQRWRHRRVDEPARVRLAGGLRSGGVGDQRGPELSVPQTPRHPAHADAVPSPIPDPTRRCRRPTVATLLAGTPIYPTQQLNDQWRDVRTRRRPFRPRWSRRLRRRRHVLRGDRTATAIRPPERPARQRRAAARRDPLHPGSGRVPGLRRRSRRAGRRSSRAASA